MKRVIVTTKELIDVLVAAHTSLRTFSSTVPKENQCWTTFDDDVLKQISIILDKVER